MFLEAAFAITLAASQSICADRQALVEVIETARGEEVVTRGISKEGALLEIWSNARTGSWTLLITSQSGRSCIASWGVDFAIAGQSAT